MAQTLYMVPEDFWIHAAPPSLLFGDADQGIQGIDPGSISAVTRTATGSGSVSVSGIPRGAFSVRVRCAVAGEINTSNIVNAGTLPAFEISRDGGATYSAPIRVSAHRDEAIIEYAPLGLRFHFVNGAAPSFLVNDAWSCTTLPSADIVAGIPVVSAFMDKYLAGSFDLPLTAYPPDFTAHAADLLRWRLLRKIGVAHRQDMQAYKPEEVMAWLEQARGGSFAKEKALDIVEQPPGTSFPMLVPPAPDPLVPPI